MHGRVTALCVARSSGSLDSHLLAHHSVTAPVTRFPSCLKVLIYKEVQLTAKIVTSEKKNNKIHTEQPEVLDDKNFPMQVIWYHKNNSFKLFG